jgi:hypothetical protein
VANPKNAIARRIMEMAQGAARMPTRPLLGSDRALRFTRWVTR